MSRIVLEDEKYMGERSRFPQDCEGVLKREQAVECPFVQMGTPQLV
jgi:hypothetical protein